MKSLFAYLDYKAYLKDYIEHSDASWGLLSKMAEAAGCQRPYLSRCLSHEIHLTMDHAYNLAMYLHLSEIETDFFLSLVEKDRASSSTYRKRIEEKLKRLKSEQEDLQKISQRPAVSLEGGEIFYYSNWIHAAIHILVSIPQYQTSKSIAEKLNLDLLTTEQTLQSLESLKLIRKNGKRWEFNSSEIHLRKESPLISMHHNNWRQKAILDSQLQKQNSLHYTVVQSLDARAYQEIRERMLKLIADFGRIAGPAPSEEVACFTCDLFQI